MREAQASLHLYALLPSSESSAINDALREGYDGFLTPPLNKCQIRRLYQETPKESQLLHLEDFVIQVHSGEPGQNLSACYRTAMVHQLKETIQALHEQHFDSVVLSFAQAPNPIAMAGSVRLANQLCKKLQLKLGLVAPTSLVKRLRSTNQLDTIDVFPTVAAAVLGLEG